MNTPQTTTEAVQIIENKVNQETDKLRSRHAQCLRIAAAHQSFRHDVAIGWRREAADTLARIDRIAAAHRELVAAFGDTLATS